MAGTKKANTSGQYGEDIIEGFFEAIEIPVLCSIPITDFDPPYVIRQYRYPHATSKRGYGRYDFALFTADDSMVGFESKRQDVPGSTDEKITHYFEIQRLAVESLLDDAREFGFGRPRQIVVCLTGVSWRPQIVEWCQEHLAPHYSRISAAEFVCLHGPREIGRWLSDHKETF